MLFLTTIPKYTAFRATDVPIFVNRAALFEHAPKNQPLPRARGPWALDSGGFMMLKANGRWTVNHQQYIGEVRRAAAEVGNLMWAAALDWMVEEEILAKTGKSVDEHQALTIESYRRLMADAPELRHLWLPVLQGATPEDYHRHFELYLAHGIDLRTVNLVGVGSVCRRWETTDLRDIFQTLQALGMRRLHGFGVKQSGLEWEAVLRRPTRPDVAELYERAFERGMPYELLEEALRLDPAYGSTTWEDLDSTVCHFMASADSAAWSDRARQHANDVRRARDRLAALRGADPSSAREEGGALYFGSELVGAIDPARAGQTPRARSSARGQAELYGTGGPDDVGGALIPTQMLPACAARAAAWRPGAGRRPHEACNQCVPWALEYRSRLRTLMEAQGCWEEGPGRLATLPPPSDAAFRAALEAAARAADEWQRFGPERFGHLEDMPAWARREAQRRRRRPKA